MDGVTSKAPGIRGVIGKLLAGLGLLALERVSRPRPNVRYVEDSRRRAEESGILRMVEAWEGDLARAFGLSDYEARSPYTLEVDADPDLLSLWASGPLRVEPLNFVAAPVSSARLPEGIWGVATSLHPPIRRHLDARRPVAPLRGKRLGLRGYQILAQYAFANGAKYLVSGTAIGESTSPSATRVWRGLVSRGHAVPYRSGFALPSPFAIDED